MVQSEYVATMPVWGAAPNAKQFFGLSPVYLIHWKTLRQLNRVLLLPVCMYLKRRIS